MDTVDLYARYKKGEKLSNGQLQWILCHLVNIHNSVMALDSSESNEPPEEVVDIVTKLVDHSVEPVSDIGRICPGCGNDVRLPDYIWPDLRDSPDSPVRAMTRCCNTGVSVNWVTKTVVS